MGPHEPERSLRILTTSIMEVRGWMTQNMLCLNEDKTEFLIAASRHNKRKLCNISLKICNTNIKQSQSIINLGVVFDGESTMSDQITSLCKSLNYNLRNISQIRKYIDESACHNAVRCLVLPRLDYCNSLLHGSFDKEIKRIQLIQNRAAKLIFQARKFDHVTPLLLRLHWLPVQKRITFKILTLTYKCLHGSAPSYLQDLITLYTPLRAGLRSETDPLKLYSPRTNLTSVPKGFYAFSPILWNQLPSVIRYAPTLSQFQSLLKTHLFP